MLQRARGLAACCAVLALTACGSTADRSTSEGPVLSGLDVLLRDGSPVLEGRRVGLITNHTGLDRTGELGIYRLHDDERIDLVALFSPEHSITGRIEAGEHVDSGHESRTGLPVHSLYGETRVPTAEMLSDVDVLVFDIQDIGTRYYTYVWTMALSLRAAAEHGKDFVVLDRPNPIGGDLVQGNVLDSAHLTFVGQFPVPMRHGFTPGELAQYLNAEHGFGARLTVIPVENWRRSMWFEDTGLPWVPPSPNMPSVESATHYAGTCLFEGTNVSVGRGTDAAFSQIGAPWVNSDSLAARLQRYDMPGVRFESVTFTPQNAGDGKFSGVPVHGVRFITTDRTVYDPARAGIAALVELHAMHADSLTFRESHFDRLAGREEVRTSILAGASVDEITADWQNQRSTFMSARERHLLYR